MLNNDYMKKWARIEEYLAISNNIPNKLLNYLEKAYKNNISEQKQIIIINEVYKQLFTSDTEVKND